MNGSMSGRLAAFYVLGLGAALWALVVSGANPRFIPVVCVLAITGAVFHHLYRKSRRRQLVLEQPFPAFLRKKLRNHYPSLTDRQVDDVERGLRQFFVASAQSNGRYVAMPSKVVDALWHEFILHTRGYEAFCKRVFGRMLHHTPTEAMPADGRPRGDKYAGLRRAWYWSCKEEGINPRKPERLPLLFALDTTLGIEGGYYYVPDCRLLGADRGDTHCADGFGCGSSCGSSCGSGSHGGGDGGGDGGGGDGGGCGSGCGGGCGGGGD